MKAVIKALLIKELEGFDISKKKINGLAGKIERAVGDFGVKEPKRVDDFRKENSIFDPRPKDRQGDSPSNSMSNTGEGVSTPQKSKI